MNRLVLIGVIVVGVFSVYTIGSYLVFTIGNTANDPGFASEFPPSVDIKIDTTTRIPGDVRTYKETTALGSGNYQLTPLDPEQPNDFDILYSESNDSYVVALGTEPLGETRQRAEQYLLQQLNVSEAELCSLNVFVSVPFDVNQFLAGEDLGLSFCPGSYDL